MFYYDEISIMFHRISIWYSFYFKIKEPFTITIIVRLLVYSKLYSRSCNKQSAKSDLKLQ